MYCFLPGLLQMGNVVTNLFGPSTRIRICVKDLRTGKAHNITIPDPATVSIKYADGY